MKFFIFLAIAVIAALVYFHFFGNLNQSINPFENGKSSSSTPAYNNQAPSGKNSSSSGSATPSGFKGPTGQPHIIGPSGPPPNY